MGRPFHRLRRDLVKNSHVSLCLFVLITVSLSIGCQRKVAVPKNFKHWNSADGAFALDYPSTWIAQGGIDKNRGNSHVKLEKGGVSIRVDASFQQSVIGDILGGSFDTTDMPDSSQPEALLHEKNLDYYKDNYQNYQEEGAETIKLPIGAARVAEFTAADGLFNIRGIRATIVTRDKGVTFRAYAPEGQWEDFGPVFDQMLESMKRGVKK